MQAVSSLWEPALGGSPSFHTECTITIPGGTAVTVEMERRGTLQVSRSRIRRRLSNIRLLGGKSVYEMAAYPGAVFRVLDGLYYGSGEPELVPLITGTAAKPAQAFGAGSVGLSIVDFGQWLSEARFRVPFVGAAGATRPAVIASAIATVRPGTVVENLSSDTGTLAVDAVWADSASDVIDDLTSDGGTDGRFDPDGVFRIRDLPAPNAPAVTRIMAKPGSTLEDAARTQLQDRIYNGVIVRRSPTNPAQTWDQQEAWVTDLTDPRHPTYIGYRPYFVTAPTALTAAVALNVARQWLVRILRPAEQLQVEAIANPALDVDDVVSVVTAAAGGEPSDGFTHFIDSISMDLRGRSMSLETVSQVVLSV